MANTDNIAKPTRLPWIQGNQIELALPLQIVYFTENGKYIQDYIPQQGDVIKVLLESKCHCYEYTPTVEDGNVLHITDDGQLCVGTYSVTVAITNTTSGKKHRSKWNYVIDVYDDNAKVVEEFDDFPDWGEGAIIDNSVFYFVGTKDIEYITVDTIEQLPQEGVIGNIYRVANYDGTQVNPHSYAEYDWNGTQYKLLDVKNYGIDEKPTNGSTNLVESGGVKSSLDEKANKNGYYETLGAGTATNLSAIDAHNNTFKYRKTGGTQSVVNGAASLEGIKGNTLVWNQWCNSGSRTTYNCTITLNSDGSITLTRTNVSSYFWLKDNVESHVLSNTSHKYYISVEAESNVSGKFCFGGLNSSFIPQSIWCAAYRANIGTSYVKFSLIPTGTPNNNYGYLRIGCESSETNISSITFRNMVCIDLTLIYGSGNEPSTPEQFEADYFRWFGKPLTYEPYDAGSLRNVQMQGLKTVGFNQWDEKWEVGQYRNDNGALYVNNYNIRCKNLIPVIGGSSYYCKCPSQLRVCTYDSEKNFLGLVYGGWQNNIKTFDNNVAYISICTLSGTSSSPITTYNNDICTNISDTNKNGTYEPYEEHNVSVPVTTLTGKVNGEGESVVIFPDGMNGVGDIKDEIKVENGVTKAIKRIGRVDLGSLTWTFQTTFGVLLTTGLNSIGKGVVSPNIANICCAKYCTKSTTTYANMLDKTIQFGGQSLAIKDSSYTNAAIFKTAMSGVYLDYELAEPIEYVVDDFALPVNYIVNNNGTEEIIDAQNTIGIAPTVLLRYSIDAAKTITNLPVDFQSQESMANLLNALGAAMGGTWTTTFDTTTNRYTYSFTPNT